MPNKQKQSSGDNSQNIQANNVTIVNGITEERVRAIIDERLSEVLKGFSQEARQTGEERNAVFESDLLPKLIRENILDSLKDPSVQILLASAQKSAASTERVQDYSLLSELLIHRVKKGENRSVRAGVARAVEVVDKISDEALVGITLYLAIVAWCPASGSISHGLKVLDRLYSKITQGGILPSGSEWLDHLDILDVIRVTISGLGALKKISQFIPERLSGYIDIGIEKDSESYSKAMEIIKTNNLPNNIIVPHELRDNYFRVNIPNKGAIKDLSISEVQKKAVEEIYGLYSTDQTLRAQNIDKFMQIWDSFSTLKTVKEWWDSIPQGFNITAVGKVLAHANAQRCDPTVPPID